MTRRYAGNNTEVYELWWWYKQQISEFTDNRIPAGWWYYGQFDNGDTIKKSMRELYRNRVDLRAAFPSPRKTGKGSFHEWLQHHST
jgi:hypothetical protein